MVTEFVITRRHGTVVASGREGSGLILALKSEFTEMNLDAGDQIAISLIENEETKEKHILIERMKRD